MTDLYTETIEALAKSLTCAMVSSPIALDEGVFPVNASDADITAYAVCHGFTNIPLFDDSKGNPPAYTHLAQVNLKLETLEQRRTIDLEDLISESTPISDAIHLLVERPFFVVLDGNRVTKVLTVADLNRLPVRTYLHTLLDHLEGSMATFIENEFLEDGWFNELTENRRIAVRQLQDLKRTQDFDSRLIDCTTFSDKISIFVKLAGAGGIPALPESKNKTRQSLQTIRRLRNLLAHGEIIVDSNIDRIRDHLNHSDQLTKRRDISWLSSTVRSIESWIALLSMRCH